MGGSSLAGGRRDGALPLRGVLGTFAEQAATHPEAAVAAGAAMLEENEGEGIDAFAVYWQKIAGSDGYVVDCGIVAGAVSVAYYSAGGLVLTLKLLVIAQLVAYAVLLVAAIATVGASLAAAAEIAAVVNRTITTFVAGTITAIQQLGVPLSGLRLTTSASTSPGSPAVHPLLPGRRRRLHDTRGARPGRAEAAGGRSHGARTSGQAAREEIADIQRGRARWDPPSHSYITDSGRRYKVKQNGTVFPVDGPDFEQLNRTEYKALQALIRHGGDRAAAEAQGSRAELTAEDFDKAGAVYQHYGK